jgi:hypothetical protein
MLFVDGGGSHAAHMVAQKLPIGKTITTSDYFTPPAFQSKSLFAFVAGGIMGLFVI